MNSASMCSGQERLNHGSSVAFPTSESGTLTEDVNNSTRKAKSEDDFSILLELAADNDAEGFKLSICNASAVDETGLWYGRQGMSKRMALVHRTPLMVAATYGSIDVLRLILYLSEADVSRSCFPDKVTALHCAAFGGSANAVDVVKLLLHQGADPNSVDVNGHRPCDVIVAPPESPEVRVVLEELLKNGSKVEQSMEVSVLSRKCNLSPRSASPENGLFSDSASPLVTSKPSDVAASSASERKEYPIDPSLDVNNGIYASDEFRMFSFKVRPCSRAYTHDWTECPFVHPGENARRRDPRKYHYSCVPCPEFRKGTCRRGDMCEYAHGVFESWLHPAQYRTRLCKDGINCDRRVCFFAHKNDELRPLYVSTGSAISSPRSTSAATTMDMVMALSLLPGSPSAPVMPPSPFTPPMSPSGNANLLHPSMAWSQQNIPTLQLPGSSLQTSRLRSALNARDFTPEELNMLQQDFEVQQQQLLNGFLCSSQPQFTYSSANLSIHSKSLTPSNLDELFSGKVSSPCYDSSLFSPSHKSSYLHQVQHQQLRSPRSFEPASPMSSRQATLAHREKQQQQLRSLSLKDLGSNFSGDLLPNHGGIVGSPVNSLSKWEISNDKVDWSVQGEELVRFQKSSSRRHNGHKDEPDLSWVQSLMPDSPAEMKEKSFVPISNSAPSGEDSNPNSDHINMGAWLEQMQLDEIVA